MDAVGDSGWSVTGTAVVVDAREVWVIGNEGVCEREGGDALALVLVFVPE